MNDKGSADSATGDSRPTAENPGQRLKNISAALIFGIGGATVMLLGTAWIAIPGQARVGVAVANIGFLIAAAALGLRKKPPLGLRQQRSKPVRCFLWFFACFFFLMIIKNLTAGASNLHYCSDASGKLGLSIPELIHQSLGNKPDISQQQADIYGKAQDKCFFGFMELNVAAACTFFLIAVLRDLKTRGSRNI